MSLSEIIGHWTGWCPKKQMAQKASMTYFRSEETSMESHKGMGSRTKGLAVIALVVVGALVGMRLEFDSIQSPDWILRDSKAVEGYQWLANNAENDAVVLAWWDYADGIRQIGNRGVVINEASKSIQNTIGGYTDSGKPWHKIEYALWYPYESEEKVNNVASFFLSENATSARKFAQKYGANYALAMSDDMSKYFAVLMATGRHFADYVNVPDYHRSSNFDIMSNLKKETIYTKMVAGDDIEGFSKEFDNGHIRIYKIG
jgi:asparagine N-glycosylation enzyme membrane subunit Stt3